MAGHAVSLPEDTAAERVILDADFRSGGLAAMLADLISQNLSQHPGKEADFRRLDGAIVMEVPDAGVVVTLEFSRGRLVVHEGSVGQAGIRIVADSRTLLGLPMVKISGGLPNLFDPGSRTLRHGLVSGAVRIAGMLRHPITMLRFTRLISVNG